MINLDVSPRVWGITGNLGGGKTLTAVSIAVSSMRRGFFVVSNVSLNLDAICRDHGKHLARLYQHFAFDGEDFDPFKLPCGSPRGSGGKKRVIVIIDECAEWIDQYKTVKEPRIARFMSWLRQSSKRSQDVLLVVQRLGYINKSVRELISKWVIVDDLAVWRAPIIRQHLPFCSGLCMQRVFDLRKQLVQGPLFVRKSTWGKYYNTAECLNADGARFNSEYSIPLDTRADITPLFYFAASFFLVLVFSSLFPPVSPKSLSTQISKNNNIPLLRAIPNAGDALARPR